MLRPPIGEGDEGKIYAVAISPDGERVAAGGWTGREWDGGASIYFFDRRTGRLLRRIWGLPLVVVHLAWSPDGARIAAMLGGANGLLVLRAVDGEELFRDTEPEDTSYGADFDAAGYLVTSSFDGRIRLYDPEHRRLAVRKAPGGERPFTVAFSPDGRRIAVGYEDSTRVDILSGEDLRLLDSADTEGTILNLVMVTWSADSTVLFAAGRYSVGGMKFIRRWSEAGRGPARDLDGPQDTVTGLRALADGRLVFGAQDPAWGVLDADGERLLFRGPSQADPRSMEDGFRVDHRGERIRFAFEAHGKRPAVFSLPERRLGVAEKLPEGSKLVAPRTIADGLEITGWENTYEPRLGGEPLLLEDFEMARSLALAPDGRSFLLGTDWNLRSFDRDGRQRWQKPAPGVAWSVNLTPDGRLAVAAFGDGTIRWYRADDGEELLAFFPHVDGQRWVLWTPSGYFDASVDGEDLIGWHVNNGPNREASFFPAWHFRDTYHRPDVIDLVLETLDEAEALRRAGSSARSSISP